MRFIHLCMITLAYGAKLQSPDPISAGNEGEPADDKDYWYDKMKMRHIETHHSICLPKVNPLKEGIKKFVKHFTWDKIFFGETYGELFQTYVIGNLLPEKINQSELAGLLGDVGISSMTDPGWAMLCNAKNWLLSDGKVPFLPSEQMDETEVTVRVPKNPLGFLKHYLTGHIRRLKKERKKDNVHIPPGQRMLGKLSNMIRWKNATDALLGKELEMSKKIAKRKTLIEDFLQCKGDFNNETIKKRILELKLGGGAFIHKGIEYNLYTLLSRPLCNNFLFRDDPDAQCDIHSEPDAFSGIEGMNEVSLCKTCQTWFYEQMYEKYRQKAMKHWMKYGYHKITNAPHTPKDFIAKWNKKIGAGQSRQNKGKTVVHFGSNFDANGRRTFKEVAMPYGYSRIGNNVLKYIIDQEKKFVGQYKFQGEVTLEVFEKSFTCVQICKAKHDGIGHVSGTRSEMTFKEGFEMSIDKEIKNFKTRENKDRQYYFAEVFGDGKTTKCFIAVSDIPILVQNGKVKRIDLRLNGLARSLRIGRR